MHSKNNIIQGLELSLASGFRMYPEYIKVRLQYT